MSRYLLAGAVVVAALAALVWLSWSEHRDGMQRLLDDIDARRRDDPDARA